MEKIEIKELKEKKLSSVKNSLLQKYVSKRPNDVICIDISFVNKKCCFLVGIDLASRAVVGHFLKNSPIETSDVLEYLSTVLDSRSFISEVFIIHSDRGSLFTNDKYYDFLKSRNITVSRGSSKAHENQVVERLNRALKFNLKKFLEEKHPLPSKSFRYSNYSIGLLKESLNSVIEEYNNNPHKHNFKMSPNAMDQAFFDYYRKETVLVPVKAELVKNDLSEESKEIIGIRKQVVSEYCGDWGEWFMGWKRKQTDDSERIFNELLESRRLNSDLSAKVDFLTSEAQINKDIRIKRALAKAKRDSAAKLPSRDSISREEFDIIISLIKTNRYSCCRRRFAMALLYVTGLRVSNLLVFTVRHIKSLTNSGSVEISLIKKGSARHKITLGEQGLELLNSFSKDLKILCKDKSVSDRLFTSKDNFSKPIARQTFDEELNKVLIEVSSLTGKHIRTHSYRASLITDLLISKVPIDEVKEIIGHSDIKSTLTYKRSRLTDGQVESINKTLDKTRS